MRSKFVLLSCFSLPDEHLAQLEANDARTSDVETCAKTSLVPLYPISPYQASSACAIETTSGK